MFGLFSKEIASNRHNHSTARKDWERMLDEIFVEVLVPWRSGLGIVSNTVRVGTADASGRISQSLSFRIKDKLPVEVKNSIRMLHYPKFEEIFTLMKSRQPDLCDCYILKNLQLPDNILIYPFDQTIDEGNAKRGLFLIGTPYSKREINKQLGRIQIILQRETAMSKIAMEIPKSEKNRDIPKAIPLRNIAKVSQDELKKRLNYLEDLNKRTKKEDNEMKNLEDYLIRLMKNKFT